MAYSKLNSISSRQWDERKARHLLNRAGFGIPRDRIQALVKLGPEGAVESLVRYESLPTPSIPLPELATPESYYRLRAEMAGASDSDRRKANMERNRRERQTINRLKSWWLRRMTETERPLEEKMALFWHGHFATSSQKVQSSFATHALNDTFRRQATGNFKALTIEAGQSVSMLRYLDNNRNVKGKPNENWARELMELFTMGQGQYTEDDIKESARAFTGWNFNRKGFAYQEAKHDYGPKRFLGHEGNFDGWDILDIIFRQPVTAEFIAGKLWSFFAYEDGEPELVTHLAQTLRDHDYALKPMLQQLFLSKAFYSDESVGTQLKSPVQLVIQLAHDLEMENPPYAAMTQAAAQLGQHLFYPPNVKGWEGGRTWINANALMQRYNLPSNLVRAHANTQERTAESGPMMAGESMAANREPNLGERFRAMLEILPVPERQALRQRVQAAPQGRERRQMIEGALTQRALQRHWNPGKIFAALSFETAGECADALAERFLNVPLAKAQRAVLLEALGPGEARAPLAEDQLGRDAMNATLHLLMSMAEYQLC